MIPPTLPAGMPEAPIKIVQENDCLLLGFKFRTLSFQLHRPWKFHVELEEVGSRWISLRQFVSHADDPPARPSEDKLYWIRFYKLIPGLTHFDAFDPAPSDCFQHDQLLACTPMGVEGSSLLHIKILIRVQFPKGPQSKFGQTSKSIRGVQYFV